VPYCPPVQRIDEVDRGGGIDVLSTYMPLILFLI